MIYKDPRDQVVDDAAIKALTPKDAGPCLAH